MKTLALLFACGGAAILAAAAEGGSKATPEELKARKEKVLAIQMRRNGGVVRKEGSAALSELVALRGIGPWTAEVYLLFAAGHPDVFPAGDVALQTAVGHAFAHEIRPDAVALRKLAEDWAPWRGVAARLFWAYYAAIKGREAAPLL